MYRVMTKPLITGAEDSTSAVCGNPYRGSSVGQSVRLISGRSRVQAPLPVPMISVSTRPSGEVLPTRGIKIHVNIKNLG